MRKLSTLVAGLLLTALAASAAQAQRRVTGRITAVGGEPLVGASVNIVGTTVGTITTDDGRFGLTVPNNPVQVQVRRIGYKRKVLALPATQNELNVELDKDVLQLEAEVITGQATTVARVNSANAVSQVSAADLTRAPASTIENALAGKAAGVTITQNSGAPGGGNQIRMRGATSIFGGTDPLYVVDGVPISNQVIASGVNAITAAGAGLNSSSQDNSVNRIADLNPNDIESIDILKGAAASAIYGSRASNGVVIITTKKGAPGRTQWNVTQRFGQYSQANELGQLKVSLEDAIAQGTAAGLTEQEVRDNYTRCNGYCNNEKAVFGETPLSYETVVSARGGGQNTSFFASGLVHGDGGIVKNTGYDKQSLRLNLQQLVGSRLTFNINTNLTHAITRRGISNNDNVGATPYFSFPGTPSWFDLRPRNGVYPLYPGTPSNPVQTVQLIKTPEEVFRVIGFASGSYNAIQSEKQTLQLRVEGGLDQFNQQDNFLAPPELFFLSQAGLRGTTTAQSGTSANANLNTNLIHTYFPANRLFTATTSIGTRRTVRHLRTTNVVGQGVVAGQQNIDRATAQNAFANHQLVKDFAVYGQEELLTLNERLLLTAGVTAERSSNNGDQKKFYAFPKASASYRLPTFAGIEELKVRAAYGLAANQPIFGVKNTVYTFGVYDNQGSLQGGPVRGLPDVRPERQNEIEGGVDVTGFNSRVALSLTGYQKRVTDLLLNPTLAPTTGFTSQWINGGEIRNRGIEAELGLTPVQTKNFNWVSRTVFARNIGKVISLPDIVGRVECLNADKTALQTDPLQCPRGFTVGAFGFAYGQGRIEEGKSPTQIVAYDTTSTGKRFAATAGNTEPDYTVGFSNEFNFGRFRVYGLLDWRKGGSVVNLTQSVYDDYGVWPDTAGTARREEAVGTLHPYVQDATFLKLREVSLRYSLPPTLVGRLFSGSSRNVNLELSGRNLWTKTKYEGLDPEVSNFGNQNIIRNQDLAPFAPTKSFFFSVDVSF